MRTNLVVGQAVLCPPRTSRVELLAFSGAHGVPRPTLASGKPFAVGLIASVVLFAGFLSTHAENLLLKNATVHTVSGETLSPGEVLIRDGKIAGVGKTVSPEGATVVDLKGLHLYPAMIALDTVVGLAEIQAVRATRDDTEVGEFTPDVESWIAVNPDSELLAVTRANGVGYFEPVPQGRVVSGQSGLVALDGWTTEQMTVKKPLALHVFWPNMQLNLTPRAGGRRAATAEPGGPRSIDEQAKERRARIRALDDFFEDARAYVKALDAAAKGDTPKPLRNPSWEAMLPFVRGEAPVTIHADDLREIRAAVAWASTNKIKMILAEGRDAWMAADLLATNKVPVIYSHIYTQPARQNDSYDVHFKAPEVLRKAGVTVAFCYGSGTTDAPITKNLPYAAAQAVAFGLPEDEAVKGVTLYPAQIAGAADRLGSIETGKDASLFAIEGNILDIRASMKRMWIAGKEVSLESKHTRLYEKYKNRPKAK